MFGIRRFHYIEVLFLFIYFTGARNIIHCTKDSVLQMFFKSRFPCTELLYLLLRRFTKFLSTSQMAEVTSFFEDTMNSIICMKRQVDQHLNQFPCRFGCITFSKNFCYRIYVLGFSCVKGFFAMYVFQRSVSSSSSSSSNIIYHQIHLDQSWTNGLGHNLHRRSVNLL